MAPAIVTEIDWPATCGAPTVAPTKSLGMTAMIRVLLIAIVSLTALGACSQTAGTDTGSTYRHGGSGPPFSSRILP